MNLAIRDLRRNAVRAVLAALGIGLLLTAAIGMVGLYRGIVQDALLIIDTIGADLWVVQGEREGPFAETSALGPLVERRAAGVPGVAVARRFTQFSHPVEVAGQRRRATVTGLDWPRDDGAWIPLAAGRPIRAGRFEMVADDALGLRLGQQVRLGRETFEVVGIARGMVDLGGDPLVFLGINDALDLAAHRPAEAVLLGRAAAAGGAAPEGRISAVLVSLEPGAEPNAVAAAIAAWGDLAVLTAAAQRDLLLNARLWRLRVQILAFTGLLLAVTGLVVSLLIYTMTLEKLHPIALLKLLGASDARIAAMIVQQAVAIGAAGFVLALVLASAVFPAFPRRVAIETGDLAVLATLLAAICVAGAWTGIARALRVRAQEVLA
jgi:putative ABC transport system permease protein